MPEPMDNRSAPRDVLLERMRYAVQQQIGGSVAESLEFEEMRNMLTNEMVYRLEVQLLGRPLGRIVYTFPATPWDHWKREYLPRLGRVGRWYLRRHPVREGASVTSASAIFPEAHLAYPTALGPVRFAIRQDFRNAWRRDL